MVFDSRPRTPRGTTWGVALLCALLAAAFAWNLEPLGLAVAPTPDTQFLYGGWSDPAGAPGNLIRFRGIHTRLPNLPGAEYIEGRYELLPSADDPREIGVWNFGETQPVVILNIVHREPPSVEFWAIEPDGPERARVWQSARMEDFQGNDWKSRLPMHRWRRIDADPNPPPKLTREQAQIPAAFEIVN